MKKDPCGKTLGSKNTQQRVIKKKKYKIGNRKFIFFGFSLFFWEGVRKREGQRKEKQRKFIQGNNFA